MISNENEIYQELQKHLDNFAIGFPTTKSGVEFKILRHLFTPEEAKLATFLRFSFESIEIIQERMKRIKFSIPEFEKILERLVKKGCINRKKVDGKKLYANAVLVIGMYEYQVKNLSKDFIKDFFKYTKEAFGRELNRTGITQLRTIPVEQSINHDIGVASYETIKGIIKDFDGQIAVVECICRNAMEVLERSCKQTSLKETCFPFGWHAQFFIDNGWGRPIEKEEVLRIINQAQNDGLVIQASNTIKPHVICCCCSCCCGAISPFKKLKRPIDFFTSNYFAEIDLELCEGCMTCIERCRMDALKIKGDKAYIDLDRCIGCGNCVAVCPQEAIKLKVKENKKIPVRTMNDLYVKIMNHKNLKKV